VVKFAVIFVLAVLGAGVGAWVANSQPVVYRSETRLAVGPESFLTQSVPGFAEASQSLASNYARYVEDSQGGITRVAGALGVDPKAITSIQASPIAGSNVVRIEVAAKDADVANRATRYLARGLIKKVNSPPPELPGLRARLASTARAMAKVEARLEDLSRQASRARALHRTLESARISQEQVAAKTALSLADANQQAAFDQYKSSLQEGSSAVTLQQVRVPQIVSDSTSRTLQWGMLAGAAAGVLVGLTVLSLWYAGTRARRRRR
jgi:uncharacterized protein involved in exopolysaccharide biosynthesis